MMQNTAGVYSRDVMPDKRHSRLHILRYTEVRVKITSLNVTFVVKSTFPSLSNIE
jgi:hypothetical protein